MAIETSLVDTELQPAQKKAKSDQDIRIVEIPKSTPQSLIGVKDDRITDDQKTNHLYYEYYKAMVPDEIDQLIQILQSELPTTFRICESSDLISQSMEAKLLDLASNIASLDHQDSNPLYQIPLHHLNQLSAEIEPTMRRALMPLQPLTWYPNSLAWQFNISRQKLRRSNEESSIWPSIHNFLVESITLGFVSRQEAVSMIPPFFMNIKPNHLILDMCAAPGSKTVQLIEMLHKSHQEIVPHDQANNGSSKFNHYIISGVVVANDFDKKRCSTLITQAKRLNSSALIVTNHDAQRFPLPLISQPSSGLQETNLEKQYLESTSNPFKILPLLFDRILCDVPCSGDGTLRKNIDLWPRWVPTMGAGLHTTQLKILMRAITLARPGALIVYSTCSLNPVEDEAVVAAAITKSAKKRKQESIPNKEEYVQPQSFVDVSISHQACCSTPDVTGSDYSPENDVPGSESLLHHKEREQVQPTKYIVSLVDTTGQLPLLKRRPGLHTWKCMDNHMNWYTNYEDLPKQLKQKFVPTTFPLTLEKAKEIHLERCMRFFPHDQNTGGFFVAVLEKIVDFDTDDDLPGIDHSNKRNSSTSLTTTPAKVKSRSCPPKYLNFNNISSAGFDSIWDNICSFYGLPIDFPRHLLFSCSEHLSKIYFVSSAASTWLNQDVADKQYLHVRSAGVRIFEKLGNAQNSLCIYRATQDGIYTLFPFLGPARVVELDKMEDIVLLLESTEDLFFDRFSPTSKDKLLNMANGSVVYAYHQSIMGVNSDDNNNIIMENEPILTVGWRGRVSTHLLLKAQEKQALLHIVLGQKRVKESDTQE